MATITTKSKNVNAVISTLKYFTTATQSDVIKIINKSLATIKKSAKAAAPSRGVRRTGKRKVDLKSRIGMSKARLDKGKYGGKVVSRAPHSHLVEFGTKAHIINKGGKRRVMLVNGTPVSGEIQHSGSKAKPFMRPAYYKERGNFERNVIGAIKKDIKKVEK